MKTFNLVTKNAFNQTPNLTESFDQLKRSSYVNKLKLMTQALMHFSTFIELGKYHFNTMSERTLCYWTEKV
jgi:hypothetical protein